MRQAPGHGRIVPALLLLLLCVCAAHARPRKDHADTPAPTPQLTAADAAAVAAAQAYTAKINTTYQYPFGPGKPFLPSNAATAGGGFIDPSLVLPAKYCEHCHEASYHQWRASAHANSFRSPWYIKNVDLLINQGGIAATRHCEGCHNPTALFSGSLTPKDIAMRGSDEDGITCMNCHAIQKVSYASTGAYVMGTPSVLLDAKGNPILGEVSDAEILAHLDRHSAAVMKPFYKTSEMCSVCHKAALPRQLNGYKWQRAFFVYDEWQLSSFAKQSPLPFYVKDHVSGCASCHMTREPLTAAYPDAGAKDGTLASHRWLGANTLLPTFYHNPEQLQKTIAFLQTGDLNVDLFGLEKGTGDEAGAKNMIAPLGATPVTVEPDQTVTTTVVIQNKGIGHSLVPEQRDMYQAWVEFLAKDANGRVLDHSGALRADGTLDPRAHSFTNRLINDKGTLNADHEVWNTHVVAYNNTIQSGRAQLVRYQFRIPGDATFPITVTAKVNYRRFDRHFLDFGLGPNAVEPVVVMASRTRTFNKGLNPAAAPDSADNPVWMRWNNFGIALLDAQQYGASVRAFEQVAKMRPDYPDAYTNIALANFQWQRYDASHTALVKALQLSPNNARALYYMALVERNEGDLNQAITDLEKVAAEFPQSRDAHRELGFSYYQEHKYAEARVEYEKVQAIDPDDLAAHYILSIVYRRLGMGDQAHAQAAIFADEKNDPGASTYAFDYLQAHPEIAAESVPWHTHVYSGNEDEGAKAAPQHVSDKGAAPLPPHNPLPE